MDYVTLKWLHVLSSTILFGTGVGSAFYLFFASRTGDVQAVAFVSRWVVVADTIFTATTAIFQPLSGWYLAKIAGFAMSTPWIAWSLALYVLAGACWLPVVWIQIRMRDLAVGAAARGEPLPPAYFGYFRVWTILGMPAFAAFIAIFWLMIAKPAAG
jgi:uncharacterized membrane protein